MKVIKMILRVLFNPFSLIKQEKTANKEMEFYAKHTFVILLWAVLITALVMLYFYFVCK